MDEMAFYEDMLKRKRMLPQALGMQSPAGVLTQDVQPGNALPRSMSLRKQIADLEGQTDDMSAIQAYGRQQGESGKAAMLNALAAQFAGESFQPVQGQYLKRAMAAQEPMRVGKGMVTPDGQYIVDPGAKRESQIGRLSREAEFADRMESQQSLQAERIAASREAAQSRADTQRAIAEMRRGQNGMPRAPSGYEWVTNPDGSVQQKYIPGGPADPASKAQGPATEDERKAAGWYFQADKARRDMDSVLLRNPSASAQTFAERGAGLIPAVGDDIANFMRPEERQQFVQAASAFAEATLRAATGAGVTKDEAIQKVRELTPQLGDKPGQIKQKIKSQEMYLDSLRTRAGRAVAGGGAAPNPAGASNDPLGLRR